MVYVFICKDTGRVACYGSLVALSKHEEKGLHYLYGAFSRDKKKEVDQITYRVVKCHLIRSS